MWIQTGDHGEAHRRGHPESGCIGCGPAWCLDDLLELAGDSRAGISTFDLSRYMGAMLTMIDRHRRLARDGREHAIQLLDRLNASEYGRWWTLVEAAWTPKQPADVSSDNRKAEIAG